MDKEITAIVPYNIVNTINSLKSTYGSTKIEVKLVNDDALSSLTDVHIRIKEMEGLQMTKAQIVAFVRDRCMKNMMPLNKDMIYEFADSAGCRLYFKVERLSNLHDGAIGKVIVKAGQVTNKTSFYITADPPIKLQGEALSVQERAQTQLRAQFQNIGDLGIGGLDAVVGDILKQMLVPRLLPPDLVRPLKFNASKGFILEGPPGTGKTLIVRQLANLLNAHIKILRGPEILSQYVGEAAKKVRELFIDAEADWNAYGYESPLYIIMIDEIDVLCPHRSAASGGEGA